MHRMAILTLGGSSLAECPNCGKPDSGVILNEWTYGTMKVEMRRCEKCNQRYRLYTTRDGRQYTIPKPKTKTTD